MALSKEEKQQEIIAQLRKELRTTKQKVRDLESSKDKFKNKSKRLTEELKEEKKTPNSCS